MAISLKNLQQNYQSFINTSIDPIHEYFNMGVFNEYTPQNSQPKPLVFNQTKQFNIIDKANDYYLSIIRWNLQSNLPVLIPDIQIKPETEKFTNLTDYELALMYSSETSEIITNTFGLISNDGKNYNGEFQNGIYGNLNTHNINFTPDNSNSVDYDNYNNGLLSNGSINGSVYIVSNGVLKIFDKVSSTLIFTLTPIAGESYNFVCVDKNLGNFYVGLTQTANNSISYIEYTRTGATTWAIGGSYVSFSNKNNVYGICLIGTNLYEFSSTQSLPDTLYGTKTQKVYDVEENIQLTGGSVISPLCQVGSAYAFAIGIDFNTYAVTTPITSPPASYFQANNSTVMKAGCLWSNINNVNLYGLNSGNEFVLWNFNCGNNPQPVPNSWAIAGEISLPSVQTLGIDAQDSTKKLIAVGNDNNLYISTYPIAPIELLFNNLVSNYNYTLTLGLNNWDSQGNQNNYIIRQTNILGNIVSGFLKRAGSYFVSENGVNLNIYSIIDYSLLNSYPNLDNNVQNLTYLQNGDLFAYSNNSNEIVIRPCSNPLAIQYTITGISYGVSGLYQLDNQHIVSFSQNSAFIYIYNFTTNTLVLTILTSYSVASLCVNNNEIVNGVPSLYVVENSDVFGLGTFIVRYTFTDSNYSNYNNPVTIYTTSNQESISFIDCHQSLNTLIFITGSLFPNYSFQNVKIRTLYSYGGYALSNMTTSPFNYNQNPFNFPTRMNSTYLNQLTTSTYIWEQVLTGTQIKAVNVSRTNENNLYAIGNLDSLLYSGVLTGLNCPLSRIESISTTYDYISSVPLSGGENYKNVIVEWNGAGNPSNSNTFEQSQTQSTSINRSSLSTNGTNLYVLYDNLNNETKLNLLNPVTLSSTTSVLLEDNILNGLIGLDENNNILVSTLKNSIAHLVGFNPLSLLSLYDNADPIVEYSTSTMSMFPYLKTTQITHYNIASDGCVNLSFIPETINTNYQSLLNYPKDKEQLYSDPYFYIKYVDTFCRMINDAIQTAFNTITGASWQHLPYFQWNAIDGKIVYNQPTSTPTGTPAPVESKWYISMNQPLYNLLNSFRFKFFPQNVGNGNIYPESIDCRYLLDTNILYDGTIQPTGEFIEYIQQISSVQTWSPVQSLVFISVVLPIEAQMTGIPFNLNIIDPSTTGNVYKQVAMAKILTDFIIPLTTGVELCNQVIDFANSGEYRLVDLIGQNSINQLSLEVYWKDKYGVLHPLSIDAGTNADLLCMLRQKSYNSKL